MASKKESDVKQAEHEAEIARLQNQFLTVPLIPKGLADPIDLPISPAVHIDESAEPLERKPKVLEPILRDERVEPFVEKTGSRPGSAGDFKKQEIDAASSLLSGMFGVSSSPPKPKPEVTEPQLEQEAKPASSAPIAPQAPAVSTVKESEAPAEKVDDKLFSSSADLSSPKPTQEILAPLDVNDDHHKSEAQQQKRDDESQPLSEPTKEVKAGIFSRARSLFSNSSKKDKKD